MAGNELTPSNQNNSLTQSISGKIEKYGGPVIEVIGSIYFNVKKWWNGEITGKRCAKSIIDDGAKVGGAIGGAAGGAWIGSAIGGPIGMAIGGAIGAAVGAATLNALCELLTEAIFDLPKTAALDDAYKFLGLDQRLATVRSINNTVNWLSFTIPTKKAEVKTNSSNYIPTSVSSGRLENN